MANNPSTLVDYNGQVNAPDADYLYGSARNDSSPGDLTGTPRVAAELNDLFGWQQALLAAATITPSGVPDKIGASQYLQALQRIGVLSWSTETAYQLNGFAIGSDRVIYQAVIAQSGNNPVGDDGTNWRVFFESELASYGTFSFASESNMASGNTVGGKTVSFSTGQSLTVVGENDAARFYVVAASGDVDLGDGLFAKELVTSNVGFASVGPCNNIVFDMQRDPMKSQGAIAGEPLTTVEWGVTSNEVEGSTSITIGANTAVAGQLIGYFADDDEYYTSRVKTAGATLTLHDPLEHDVSSGRVVFAFFKDKSHPSVKGYRAIADYMLRQRVYQDITNDIGSLIYSKVGGTEVIDTLATDVFENCGSSEFPAVRMQTTIQDDGFIASDVRLGSGDACIELMINTNGDNIRLRVAMNDETATFIVDEIINTELPTKIKFPIRKKLDASMIIRMQQNDVGTADINFIMKFLAGSAAKINSLNGGTHVLHGDSWFFQEGIFERLQERLPNANIINNGVGGRTSFNLSDTVYSEVEPLKPDYVWCIAGTNDGVLGVSASDYHKWMNQLIADLKNIGSTPIMFTPAVGNLIDGWLDLSKAYMYRYDFRDGETSEFEDVIISFAGVSVGATSNVFCGTAGRTKDTVKVLEAFGNGVNGMDFGYSSGMAAPSIDVDSKAGNSILNGFTVTKADDTELYFNVSCENTTGSGQTANGFARVRIKNSRK